MIVAGKPDHNDTDALLAFHELLAISLCCDNLATISPYKGCGYPSVLP